MGHGDSVANEILVCGIPTPLKKKIVSWDDYFQYMEKEKMFQTTNQDRIINSMLDSDGVCVLKWSSDWK